MKRRSLLFWLLGAGAAVAARPTQGATEAAATAPFEVPRGLYGYQTADGTWAVANADAEMREIMAQLAEQRLAQPGKPIRAALSSDLKFGTFK